MKIFLSFYFVDDDDVDGDGDGNEEVKKIKIYDDKNPL